MKSVTNLLDEYRALTEVGCGSKVRDHTSVTI